MIVAPALTLTRDKILGSVLKDGGRIVAADLRGLTCCVVDTPDGYRYARSLRGIARDVASTPDQPLASEARRDWAGSYGAWLDLDWLVTS